MIKTTGFFSSLSRDPVTPMFLYFAMMYVLLIRRRTNIFFCFVMLKLNFSLSFVLPGICCQVEQICFSECVRWYTPWMTVLCNRRVIKQLDFQTTMSKRNERKMLHFDLSCKEENVSLLLTWTVTEQKMSPIQTWFTFSWCLATSFSSVSHHKFDQGTMTLVMFGYNTMEFDFSSLSEFCSVL